MLKYFFILAFVSLGNTQTDSTDDIPNDCICVIYYLCDTTNYTIITDGRGIIDERAGFPKCAEPTELCCRLENKVQPPTPKSVNISSACGIRNPDGVGNKITSSSNNLNMAEFGEFPWIVGILKNNGVYQCGGSLIHPSVVLTAAHCVLEKVTYTVRAGEWDSSNTKEILKHQDRTVSSVKIHEDYRPGIYYNDIALLFLTSPFELQTHINVICLPTQNATATGRCFTNGWGKDKFGDQGTFPVILKKTELPIVPRDKCQENLRKTRVGPFFQLHRSFICAGGTEGQDACTGDGGGPLVCPVNEEMTQFQQMGIVSWGIGCGDRDVPGVYTNVALFREWIEKQLDDNNFDISTYILADKAV